MANLDASSYPDYPISLFEAVGIEFEYMIVDRDSLSVRPLCDRLLQAVGGVEDNEVYPDGENGPAAWSNELVLHVVEFKTAAPVASLDGLNALFITQVAQANETLAQWNAYLMPTAMHPWMDPEREMRLWPHGNRDIYKTFDRIFDCRGHGWANLQSVHINLPFSNDAEFRRLHAAIRTVLPLLPALAASSPVMDGALTGCMDNRLAVYQNNCARIPQITGSVIPETMRGRQEYADRILQPIYQALEPLDPERVLRHEWANARGAIARFDRGAIEIRLLDIQECPGADLAIAELVCAVVKALAEERISSIAEQEALSTALLAEMLREAIRNGDTALLECPPLARCLGLPETRQTMSEAWQQLAERTLLPDSPALPTLKIIFEQGCLARRIARAIQQRGISFLAAVYAELCDCLKNNQMFSR